MLQINEQRGEIMTNQPATQKAAVNGSDEQFEHWTLDVLAEDVVNQHHAYARKMTPMIRQYKVTQTQLLDKYILPKVALTVITVSSIIGTWLTMTTHGAGTWLQVVPRWLHLISFAFLAGGYMWKALFTRRADKATQQAAFNAFTSGQFQRFRRLTQIALPIFVLSSFWDMLRFTAWGVGWPIWADLMLVLLLALLIGYDAFVPSKDADPFAERPLAAAALVLLLLTGLIQAAFDVVLAQGGQPLALLVRWLHLGAFGLWFGGAVWNIFIAVPAARDVVSLPVVLAASQQLERFRVAVRLILPTLIITGLIQAYRYIGLNPSALVSSSFGLLILAKLLLVVALIVIFVTCPIWRACSPIAGMCNLEDLHES
jgi:putative copper resistance protein D